MDTPVSNWVKQLRSIRATLHPDTENAYQRATLGLEGYWHSREYAEEFDHPLAALDHYSDCGTPPPPELVDYISELYRFYLAAAGKVGLEELLVGMPWNGRYAKDHRQTILDVDLHLALLARARKGLTPTEVAEEFVKKHDLDVDAESLLRNRRRRFGPLPPPFARDADK